MRVYLPLLLGELRDVAAAGRLPTRTGFVVSRAVRALDPSADEEDLEFEAMCQALDAARALGPGRRVVASGDVDEAPATGQDAATDAEVAVELADVVSFHLEEGEGPVGTGYDDLLWYDVTELAELTRG